MRFVGIVKLLSSSRVRHDVRTRLRRNGVIVEGIGTACVEVESAHRGMLTEDFDAHLGDDSRGDCPGTELGPAAVGSEINTAVAVRVA